MRIDAFKPKTTTNNQKDSLSVRTGSKSNTHHQSSSSQGNITMQKKRAIKALNIRAQVITVLVDVLQGQSINTLMPNVIQRVAERDIGLLHELTLGTLRHWFALDAIIKPMLAKPLKDDTVHATLLLGLYQLLQTRIPAHAAISETVDAVKQLGQEQASGLVNALLRRSLREIEGIVPQFTAHHGLPAWLEKQLKQNWKNWQHIAHVLKQTAPLTLRVNTKHCSREAYLQLLADANISAKAGELSADAVILLEAYNVIALPHFADGWLSVQDEHAQLCATLLGDINGKIVLDAAAAPGGKTAHLLEKYQPKQLIALDIDEKRLQRVHENLARLGLDDEPVHVVTGDASSWTGEQLFDAILLDAPCTATGVLRRHPDIRLLRKPSDVAQTVALQAKILDHLWTQLNVGGVLLYVTCSILKAENETQIAAFLARTPNAVEDPIIGTWGESRPHGTQCLPLENGGDGFYFARIIKRALG